ncbi:hypothetical protein M2145_002114 [Lachnospiraceae bacterium PF1-21]|uniref:DUF6075 family protein n=1 Tax=Ohessyouella blattaphilus TaxID=2949333 RepID=A0ABT1EL53_9FIRM|nr:DUF6075 family protein [Ohessyouella blattaphilus]MCP1111430.1 DUF6075 family protein [Ohessyouella blattaphilus]MCR8564824.1 DUF6075 family protein [Ohessyouella blattaphilus]
MNTALRAIKKQIYFKDEAHQEFYLEHLARCRNQDVYEQALIYCLGLSSDTRRMVDRIYDFNTNCVIPQCLSEGWITSGAARVVRLAFNLYCNDTPSTYNFEDDFEEAFKECKNYTVEEIFCCEYAPFFLEAVRLRYPEYFRSIKGVF